MNHSYRPNYVENYVEILLPATMTATTTPGEPGEQQQQLQQPQNVFQTQSSTLFHDDGHYSVIISSVSASGGTARIPSHYDYYDYIEMDQLGINQQAVDEGAVEQRQSFPDDYQGLDPSVLEILRQPPAPAVYDRLIPDVEDVNHGVIILNTDPGEAVPDNLEGVDWASLLPYEDDGSTSQSTGSAVHDDNTVKPRQTSSDNYQRLDPSVLDTLSEPPPPSVYASLSPDVPGMSQDVDNREPGGATPDTSKGLDLTSLLPRE